MAEYPARRFPRGETMVRLAYAFSAVAFLAASAAHAEFAARRTVNPDGTIDIPKEDPAAAEPRIPTGRVGHNNCARRSNYDEIHSGMDYSQVSLTMGCDGERTSVAQAGNYLSEIYEWTGPNGGLDGIVTVIIRCYHYAPQRLPNYGPSGEGTSCGVVGKTGIGLR